MSDKRSFSPQSSSSERTPKRRRSDSIDNGHDHQILKIFVVQAKLDGKVIAEIYNTIESHGPSNDHGLQLEFCNSVESADIVITGIRMSKRLERHIDWHVARRKAIVTPDWLRESVKRNNPAPCASFAAVAELHNEAVEHCPEHVREPGPGGRRPSLILSSPSAPLESTSSTEVIRPTNEKVKNNWRSKYACARAHPLICPNQELVVALNVIGRSRELEGLAVNALAYERAVAILKSYPYKITQESFQRDIVKLTGTGSKVRAKVKEYLKTGKIEETESVLESGRYWSLSLFASIHGVGPSTARQLYETGLRTIEDLERYYGVPQGFDASQFEELETQNLTPNLQPIIPKDSREDAKIPLITMEVALALRKDFGVHITRSEVEEIHRVIMAELKELQAGCVSTIVGGYRRGKMESNDVDIVISHSDLKKGANLIKGLYMVTHIMHLSGFHGQDPLRTQHWDPLEKALTVFRLPARAYQYGGGADGRRLYRRLDLIFAPPEAYWTAVIGWSGSRMFERDLRLWAKVEKGLKFDSSGLTRRHDSKLFVPKSEEDVFKILGLDWVDSTMRNANA
ncbi:DNA polymerase mu [Macrolepiota fuliginosa MF-IS2]|uniref:DNA polymerase n=1 Tax=Macrolepiota fuliginosa MF-IS2 TaxID=1400762 RepID=A0A9P5XLW6_9AGAR|nr:DNA polymerase mu [Macrolepiota fuliginosa MF-IS2]